ncbi:alpha/beta fold hydrolase [Candidatus Magnetomonas plexicatena]|uniref:alpha/beta fold hydrolase n=1 Tax=Candidatus Magnetomonas plexicatena TaxID=2552947 RepID=UPI001101C9FB|nr:alpha/beta hydrolase [Nitrospirales bacterium LBB_01]
MKKKYLYFIHGANCGSWVWEEFSEFFKIKGFHCLTPDLRFHKADQANMAANDIGTISLLDYVSDIRKDLSALDETPVLVGHSMGGLLAQVVAQSVPVRALVLLEPGPPAGLYPKKSAFLQGVFAVLNYGTFWKAPVMPTFEQVVATSLHLLSSEKQQDVYSKFVHESGRALSEIGFSILDRHCAASVDFKKVTCPVLVIAGSKDRIITPDIARSVANNYKNNTYKEFAEHAHWILQEQGWEKVAGFIFEWLEKIQD